MGICGTPPAANSVVPPAGACARTRANHWHTDTRPDAQLENLRSVTCCSDQVGIDETGCACSLKGWKLCQRTIDENQGDIAAHIGRDQHLQTLPRASLSDPA